MTADSAIILMFVCAAVSFFLAGLALLIGLIAIMSFNRRIKKQAKWFGWKRRPFEKILNMREI